MASDSESDRFSINSNISTSSDSDGELEDVPVSFERLGVRPYQFEPLPRPPPQPEPAEPDQAQPQDPQGAIARPLWPPADRVGRNDW